jgi:hypothetical protein
MKFERLDDDVYEFQRSDVCTLGRGCDIFLNHSNEIPSYCCTQGYLNWRTKSASLVHSGTPRPYIDIHTHAVAIEGEKEKRRRKTLPDSVGEVVDDTCENRAQGHQILCR